MTAPVLTPTQERSCRLAAMREDAARHLDQLWRQYCRAAQRGDTTECDRLERPLDAARIHLITLNGASS